MDPELDNMKVAKLQVTCCTHNQQNAALSNLLSLMLLLSISCIVTVPSDLRENFTQFFCKASFHSSHCGKRCTGATLPLVLDRGDVAGINGAV